MYFSGMLYEIQTDWPFAKTLAQKNLKGTIQ